MSGKFALVIGNTEYNDSGLAQLSAPGKDAEDFARVLKSKDICGFDDVKILVNQPSSSVIEEIDEFFDQKKPDDLLVLYFSGHGVKDEIGSLYLAFKNTVRSRLRSTAIKSDYIREAMDQSRSKRQVLILDCCNSGAFSEGTKSEIGGVMGMTKAFQGYGRFVLTASDATQFAWEGDKFIGETNNSLFTHFLVKGLEGEADSDGDGKITVDEIYDYTFQQISKVTPKQTPTKSSSKQEGEIILRENMRIEDIKPIALSDDLTNEIDDTRPYVREAAVQKLEKILKGRNIGLARSAREALEKIAEDENTTRRVAQLAAQALASLGENIADENAKIEADRLAREKAETKRKAKIEADRLAAQKAEDERIAHEKAETERKAKTEADRLAAQKAEDERIAREKAKQEGLQRDYAQNVGRVSNPIETNAPSKSQAKSLTYFLGGFGFLLIVGVIIVINWLSHPTAPAMTSTPTTATTQAPITTEPPTEAPTAAPPTATEIPSSTISDMDGMTLLYVPAGNFTMGSNADDALAECQKFRTDCRRSWFTPEEPPHSVYLDAFWIDQTEVTNAMYAKCISEGGCKKTPTDTSSATNSSYYGNSQFDNYPVIYVDWNMATAYCSWAGRELPTEAQWEKAASWDEATQTKTVYPWGNSIDCTFANFYDNKNSKYCTGDTTAVKSYESGKSPYGTYDMAGNVWEWVNDWYDVYPGGNTSTSADFGQKYRVLRGGSWDYINSDVRSANRYWFTPVNAFNDIGFRCARSLP
jgi:formylglycine-generating enzyme required for sulfatase activity